MIRNLLISHVEVRCEDDEDIAQYTNHKDMEIVKCFKTGGSTYPGRAHGIDSDIKALLANIMKIAIPVLTAAHLLNCDNANYLNEMVLEETSK